jgi:PKD repeat protein
MGVLGSDRMNIAWAFPSLLGNSAHNTGEVISHESGHTAGLSHDGQNTPAINYAYYSGHGDGISYQWAPIMGASYSATLSQWDKGEYSGANNLQDDLVVMAKKMVAKNDDVGDTKETATTMLGTTTNNIYQVHNYGFIGLNNDHDMYVFSTTGGLATIKIAPAIVNGNLDIKATLYDQNMNVVMIANDTKNVAALINLKIVAGTYYLEIEGAGRKGVDVYDQGYSSYGSIGQYEITGSFVAIEQITPVAHLDSTALIGDTPLHIDFTAINSVSNGATIKYYWDFGDGTWIDQVDNKDHLYTIAGTYLVKLTVSNEFGLTSSQTVQVIANIPYVAPTPIPTLPPVVVQPTPIPTLPPVVVQPTPVPVAPTPIPTLPPVVVQPTPVPDHAAFIKNITVKFIKTSKIASHAQGAVVINTINPKGQLKPLANVWVATHWEGITTTNIVWNRTAVNGVVLVNTPKIGVQSGTAILKVDSLVASKYTYDLTRNVLTLNSVTR